MKDENKIHDIHLELMARACSIVWCVDIRNETRRIPFPQARACFYRLATTQTKNILAYIGKYMEKDHSTVIHSLTKFNVYGQIKGFSKKYEKCLETYKELVENTDILDFLPNIPLNEDGVRMQELEIENIVLRIQNEIIVNKLSYLAKNNIIESTDFIEEINNLEPSLKREFKEYRWKPFKRLLETRVKH